MILLFETYLLTSHCVESSSNHPLGPSREGNSGVQLPRPQEGDHATGDVNQLVTDRHQTVDLMTDRHQQRNLVNYRCQQELGD